MMCWRIVGGCVDGFTRVHLLPLRPCEGTSICDVGRRGWHSHPIASAVCELENLSTDRGGVAENAGRAPTGAAPGRASVAWRVMPASLMATGLLFLVALGSHAVVFPPGASERTTASMPASWAGYLVVLAGPLVLALIAGLVIVLMPQGRSKEGEDAPTVSTLPRMPWWLRPVAVVALVGMIAVPIALGIWASGRSSDQPRSVEGGTGAGHQVVPQRPGNAPSAAIPWGWLVPAIAAVVAGVGIVVVTSAQRHRPESAAARTSSATRARHVLADSIADLHAEADPQRAVVAAYARMEHDLTTVGLPRRTSETAPEYLERLLASFDVSPSSAIRLTDLFEHAKFGTRPMDGEMKREAIACLERVAAEVSEVG